MKALSFAQIVQLSLFDLWQRVVEVLPDIIGALVIVIIGLIVAPIVGGIVKKVIEVLKIDELSQKMGVHDMVKGYSSKFSVSTIIGKLVKWFIILAFLLAASDVLGWNRVSDFLNEIIFYIPQVLIAIVIMVFGIIAGKFFEAVVVQSLKGSNTPVNNPEALGGITRWAFVVFAGLASLLQLGIAPSLIEILFAGFVLALALAFGLGGKDHASKILTKLEKKKK